MTTENWKPIPETDYSVSSLGRVASRKRGGWQVLRDCSSGNGYRVVGLCVAGKIKVFRVHRLVAQAFLLAAPTAAHEINHKDGDKANNRVDNLEWVTSSENTRHAYSVLGHKAARGERCARAKLTTPDVVAIRRELAEGTSQSEIARRRKMHPSSICDIANKITWGHI